VRARCRLSAELEQLGAWFQLRPGTDDDLPQFGFSDLEQPVVERLRDGGTLAEIEAFASSFVEGSTVRAVIYALASCNACNLEPPPGQPRARLARAQSPSPAALAASTPPVPRFTESTQPMAVTESTQPMMRAAGPAPSDEPMRTMTQPLTRSPGPEPPEPADARAPRPTPGNRTVMPANQAARPAAMPLTGKPTPTGTGAEPAIAKTTTRVATVPPPPRPPPASDGTVPPPASGPSDSEDSVGRGPSSEPTDPGVMRARRPTDDAKGWDNPGGSPRATTRDAVPRSRSSASIHIPSDEVLGGSGSSGSIRLPDGARRSDRSNAALRIPSDDALREALSDTRTQTGDEVTNRNLASEALRIRPADLPRGRRPSDETPRRDGSSGSIRVPSDDALRDTGRGSGDARRRPGSSPGPRQPPPRQVARVDTPRSHEVKALIAQRLKLLDQGVDHFQLLGVPPEVGHEALRKAYFSLARQLHPDRLAALGISDDGRHAQRLFAQINAGFAILSDHARRARYVDVLRRGGEAVVRAEQARAEELTRRILEGEEAYRRGDLALRRDQPAAAVTELERAVQLGPDEADYHAALAWARFCAAADRPAAAAATRAALDRAIQRAPRSVTARFYLGRVERMLGRDQDALKHFRDVVTASPGHAEAAAELRVLESRLADKPGKPRR
jgi:hypothetical protein